MSDSHDVVRRLIQAAYEMGWANACYDHRQQRSDANHPIGDSKRENAESVLVTLDPNNLLGLYGGAS